MEQITCNFVFNEEKKIFVCSECNATTTFEGARRICNVQPQPLVIKEVPAPQLPPLSRRIVNFIAAATQHAIQGNPVVSEEVLHERLKLCHGCPLFKRNSSTSEIGGVCTHSSCGCTIQDNLNYLNKIAWADQECPIGKWGKSDNGV